MLWATRLDDSISTEAFTQALECHQFAAASGGAAVAGMYMYEHSHTRHRVIYIARTGRIQIRLDPLTRHPDRAEAAKAIYDLLYAASEQACIKPSECIPENTSTGDAG